MSTHTKTTMPAATQLLRSASDLKRCPTMPAGRSPTRRSAHASSSSGLLHRLGPATSRTSDGQYAVKRVPKRLKGVTRAEVSFREKGVRVVYDWVLVTVDQIIEAVTRTGCKAVIKGGEPEGQRGISPSEVSDEAPARLVHLQRCREAVWPLDAREYVALRVPAAWVPLSSLRTTLSIRDPPGGRGRAGAASKGNHLFRWGGSDHEPQRSAC
jgi:copper chaperone CopZ